MSHSQFHSIDLFILRHAWLNLWDKRMLLAESTRLLSLIERPQVAFLSTRGSPERIPKNTVLFDLELHKHWTDIQWISEIPDLCHIRTEDRCNKESRGFSIVPSHISIHRKWRLVHANKRPSRRMNVISKYEFTNRNAEIVFSLQSTTIPTLFSIPCAWSHTSDREQHPRDRSVMHSSTQALCSFQWLLLFTFIRTVSDDSSTTRTPLNLARPICISRAGFRHTENCAHWPCFPLDFRSSVRAGYSPTSLQIELPESSWSWYSLAQQVVLALIVLWRMCVLHEGADCIW